MSEKTHANATLEICRAYRGMFLNDDGTLKPDAEIVMRDLEKECGWMVDRMPETQDGHVDPLKLAGAYEKRRTYAHIRKRLFQPLKGLIKQTEK